MGKGRIPDRIALPASGMQRAPALGAEPGLIQRHDLMAALNRAAQKPVTIISAPTGTGKTSLLRAWADQPGQDGRIAFMTVRPAQHDMQLFWLTMLGAVRAAAGTGDGGAQATGMRRPACSPTMPSASPLTGRRAP
jgi:LuxR family transcriptional regulator, maltose regulon positive regulatory protein